MDSSETAARAATAHESTASRFDLCERLFSLELVGGTLERGPRRLPKKRAETSLRGCTNGSHNVAFCLH